MCTFVYVSAAHGDYGGRGHTHPNGGQFILGGVCAAHISLRVCACVCDLGRVFAHEEIADTIGLICNRVSLVNVSLFFIFVRTCSK